MNATMSTMRNTRVCNEKARCKRPDYEFSSAKTSVSQNRHVHAPKENKEETHEVCKRLNVRWFHESASQRRCDSTSTPEQELEPSNCHKTYSRTILRQATQKRSTPSMQNQLFQLTKKNTVWPVQDRTDPNLIRQAGSGFQKEDKCRQRRNVCTLFGTHSVRHIELRLA